MLPRHSVILLAVLVPFVLSTTAWGRSYDAFHNSTELYRTAIVVSNVDAVETSATLLVYSSQGQVLGEADITLPAQASDVLFLDDIVSEKTGRSWGLARIETDGHVALAIWIGTGDGWLSVINVSAPTIDTASYEYAFYWQTVNYANTSSRATGVSLVNPYPYEVQGDIRFYDESGEPEAARSYSLQAFESAYLALELEIEIGSTSWGMVDIRSTVPILLIAEYFNPDGTLIGMDFSAAFYFVE